MKEKFTLYHGSAKIIDMPSYGLGKKNNDYGLGFYCTEIVDLAKEWSVSENKNGFCNKYYADFSNMRILNLNSKEYSILNWIAILLENRVFTLSTPIANKARKYIIENFSINTNSYDVIIGYRADDSYFDFAESFVNNTITIDQLAKAIKLGNLGTQVVLKSKFAFENIIFEGAELVLKEQYYEKKVKRNIETNKMYYDILEEDSDGLTINEIRRRGITNDDPRIPRNTSL